VGSEPLNTLAAEARQEYDYLMERGKWQSWEIADVARADASVFGEYCFGHEQQPLHELWNDIWDNHARSCIWAPPEHGKTFHGVFVRFIWELGNNIHLQLMHVSATGVVPEGTLRRAAHHIANNARVREVFPGLRIARFGREQANNLALWLERGGMHTDRDPNWVALGMRNQIHGRRTDGVVLDDILDFDNTYTPAARKKTTGRVSNTIMGRVPTEGWIRALGYPFFKDDTMHWLKERTDFYFQRFGIMEDIHGNPGPPGLWPQIVHDPATGKVYGWPWERILAKRLEVDDLDWHRQWCCLTPSEAMALFTWDLLRIALDHGRGMPLGRECPEGIIPVSGIDPATGDGSDETVIVTGYTAGGMRDTLDVRGGLWDDPRLYLEMREVLRMYPSHGGFLVEDNGFQRLLVRTLRRADVMASYGWTKQDIDRCRVLGFTTGKNKHDAKHGVRGLQIDFKNGHTRLPSDHNAQPWDPIRQLCQGLVDYDPNLTSKHASDYVMAYWLCSEMQRRGGQLRTRRPKI
jgi:hypothetical protein